METFRMQSAAEKRYLKRKPNSRAMFVPHATWFRDDEYSDPSGGGRRVIRKLVNEDRADQPL